MRRSQQASFIWSSYFINSTFFMVVLLNFGCYSNYVTALKPCPRNTISTDDIDESGTFHWQIDPVLDLQRSEGKDVRISCNGAGFYPYDSMSPPIKMVWTHNGNVINPTKRVSFKGKTKERNLCVTDVVLKIKDLKVKDSGSYSCKIVREDTGETVLHENFTLQVKKQGVD